MTEQNKMRVRHTDGDGGTVILENAPHRDTEETDPQERMVKRHRDQFNDGRSAAREDGTDLSKVDTDDAHARMVKRLQSSFKP